MPNVPRIDVHEARRRVQAGDALLVCAYDDPEKYARMQLEGSIGLDELQARLWSLPHDQQIIFYCG
jgi:rhodanese-related sulfurtransferase